MKVFMISPFSCYGGAEKQFLKMKEVVKEVNENVEHVSLDGTGDTLVGLWGKVANFVFFDVKRHRVFRYIKAPLMYVFLLFYVIAKKKDVIYGYSLYCYPVLLFISILVRLRLLKAKVVYSERIYNSYVGWTLKIPYFYSFFDVIVLNSREMMDFFQKAGYQKCKLVANYVEPVAWSEHGQYLESKKIKDIIVAVPARINREKNQGFLISELKKSDFCISGFNIWVLLYGEVDDSEYFKALVSDGGSRVTYKGVDSISNIYNESDLVCLPSVFEGTSNVVLEAMVSRKNFLCSDIKANTDIPVSQENIFSLDEGGFISAFKRLMLLDSNERKKIAAKNYFVSTNDYSLSVYKKRVSEIFM